jgi:carbon monoxide dehydrogenase subunit G
VKLEKSFVVSCPRETLLPALDDDATFTGLFPDTRIVLHEGNRRETATPYTAVGQTRDIRFVFETQPGGRLCFEKICDGNVGRSLRGEVRLEPEPNAATRVIIHMEGRTRALVPELAIRLPMRQQLEEMARSLRERLEAS